MVDHLLDAEDEHIELLALRVELLRARDLVRQILKDHDIICSALRLQRPNPDMYRAIDRMAKVKAEWRTIHG